MTCRGCNSFLAQTEWDHRPAIDLTDSTLYHGLVGGGECVLTARFRELTEQVARGELDAQGLADCLQEEVWRLVEFVRAVECTLYPEGVPDDEAQVEEFVLLFQKSVEEFADAADLLIQGAPQGDFQAGHAAALKAADLLAEAFNRGDLALRAARR